MQDTIIIIISSSSSSSSSRSGINIIISLFWEFFTPALSDCFPLESEGQQMFSNLQDSSQYSGRSQNAIVLIVSTHPLISEFFSSSIKSYSDCDCTEHTSYNQYHRHFHVS